MGLKKEINKLKDFLVMLILNIKDNPISGTFIFLFVIGFYGMLIWGFLYYFWGLIIFLFLACIYFGVLFYRFNHTDDVNEVSLFAYLKMKHADWFSALWFYLFPIICFLLVIYIF